LIESRRPPLPQISISAVQGMFLHLLAASAPSKTVIEVGTLGGYSAAWLATALRSENRLVHTIERDASRAAFAQQNLTEAGLASHVNVVNLVNQSALEAIPILLRSLLPSRAGLVFLDANKSEYIAYVQLLEDSIAPVRAERRANRSARVIC
jgi:predicted O-methyltransferase YrrM